MKTILLLAICGATVCFFGCVQRANVEQRVVELPGIYTNSTLETAAQIGKALAAEGLGADVRKRFPNLNQQQLNGLFLTWNKGDFQGKQSVHFVTGLRYTGSLPEAKAVADYCESRVKKAVMRNFFRNAKIGKMDFPNGESALVIEYSTAISMNRMSDLRAEVGWIWDALKADAEDAKLKTGVVRAVYQEGAGLLTRGNGYGFVFTQEGDGNWRCQQDEKK